MMSRRIFHCLLCCCLLLGLYGCGNKGPLVLDEEQQQDRQKSRVN